MTALADVLCNISAKTETAETIHEPQKIFTVQKWSAKVNR